jgi:hypothetical protein
MLSVLVAALEVILEDYHANRCDAALAMFRVYELVQQFKK